MAEVTADMGKKEKPSRGRVRRVAKWVGLVVCAAVGAVYVASVWWCVSLSHSPQGVTEGRSRTLSVDCGGMLFYSRQFSQPPGDPGYCFFNARRRYPGKVVRDAWGGYLEYGFTWWPEWLWETKARLVVIPLWAPLGVLGAATAFFWYLDGVAARRRRAGQCVKCGYDRRGLVDGAACPECGAGAKPSAA